MAKMKSTEQNRWSVFAIIVSIFVVIEIVLWVVSGLIAYPTQAHRDASEKTAAATVQAMQDGRGLEFLASDEFTALTESPESRYSQTADLVTAVVHFVAWVTLIGAIFVYLRKHRLANRPVRATAWLVGVGALLVSILVGLLSHLFYPASTLAGGFDDAAYFASIPLSVGLNMLVAAVVALIVQAYYKKKFGFSE